MNTKLKPRKRWRIPNRTSGHRFSHADVARVTRALDDMARENIHQTDAIVEQLKQCPEAFKAGEMISKILEELKYGTDLSPEDRYSRRPPVR